MGSEMCIRDRPGTIAAAVWSGHRCAREPFGEMTDEVPFRLERVEFVDG